VGAVDAAYTGDNMARLRQNAHVLLAALALLLVAASTMLTAR
jgi:hypothetical protein